MGSVTVYQHPGQSAGWVPDNGFSYPPEVATTTIAGPGSVIVNDATGWVEITADVDTRVGFNVQAATSGMNVMAALPNRFRLAAGTNRTLYFL
jgi:hypothetical protein